MTRLVQVYVLGYASESVFGNAVTHTYAYQALTRHSPSSLHRQDAAICVLPASVGLSHANPGLGEGCVSCISERGTYVASLLECGTRQHSTPSNVARKLY